MLRVGLTFFSIDTLPPKRLSIDCGSAYAPVPTTVGRPREALLSAGLVRRQSCPFCQASLFPSCRVTVFYTRIVNRPNATTHPGISQHQQQKKKQREEENIIWLYIQLPNNPTYPPLLASKQGKKAEMHSFPLSDLPSCSNPTQLIPPQMHRSA